MCHLRAASITAAKRPIRPSLERLDDMFQHPGFVLDQAAQRSRHLPVLIPLRPRRHRARKLKHVATQFEHLRDLVAAAIVCRLAVQSGHDAIVRQYCGAFWSIELTPGVLRGLVSAFPWLGLAGAVVIAFGVWLRAQR
jgi:hypothetical protein